MHAPLSDQKPHTERWAYRRLYSANIFELATRIYPFFRRPGAQVLSRTVAWTYAVTQPAIRRIVRDNLSLLQKEPVSERDAISVFVNFGATIADYVAVGALSPAKGARLLCRDTKALSISRPPRRRGAASFSPRATSASLNSGLLFSGVWAAK